VWTTAKGVRDGDHTDEYDQSRKARSGVPAIPHRLGGVFNARRGRPKTERFESLKYGTSREQAEAWGRKR